MKKVRARAAMQPPFLLDQLLQPPVETPLLCSTKQVEPTRPMIAELVTPLDGDLGQDDREDRDSGQRGDGMREDPFTFGTPDADKAIQKPENIF